MPHVSGIFHRSSSIEETEPRRHSLELLQITSSTNQSENIEKSGQNSKTNGKISLVLSENNGIQGKNSTSEQISCCNSLPLNQQESFKPKRFRLMRLGYASESQLSTKVRLQMSSTNVSSTPQMPEIITTAPTCDTSLRKCSNKKRREIGLSRRSQTTLERLLDKKACNSEVELSPKITEKNPSCSGNPKNSGCALFEMNQSSTQTGPPPYSDIATSTLALPLNRLSDSSRSDLSSGDHGMYASTTTTTHTVHTTTTFFRLPRRRKKSPLFDLSHLPKKSSSLDIIQSIPHSQETEILSCHLISENKDRVAPQTSLMVETKDMKGNHFSNSSSSNPSVLGQLVLQESEASNKSSPIESRLSLRERSSTLNSTRQVYEDHPIPTPITQSTRTSSSLGRKSFGGLFGLSNKTFTNSESASQRQSSGLASSGSTTPKNSSVQITRGSAIVLPERNEDDTPAKYLIRLEEALSRGVVASVLSKGTDPFSQAVLRSYMRGFGFFGDPIDMAIRKLLMEVELPKETQQIDRCLQGFANRYHECNPGIYASPDQAYFVAFSLLILHTDVYNKNNKHKMQKSEYLKNTRGEGIFDEIFECFYDNICYEPFMHAEDGLVLNGGRIFQHKTKKKSIFSANSDFAPRSWEADDAYTFITHKNLDKLRPNLRDVLHLEEHYNYLGTATSLNLLDLQKTFFRTGVLQIVSVRSRPDAFMSDKTVNNPDEAQAGIVNIKITKVGLLWRKDPKKKKTRSPWQEWGVILTGAQLYFFKNTNLIKNLMCQLESHIKQGNEGIPITFKPPLDQFKPDALMSTNESVALLDFQYKKHKNAFIFVRQAAFEETFLADNEAEMNDWLAKLNYAAAFRTSGVRMRGVIGGDYDGQRTRGVRRLDNFKESIQSVQTSAGEVSVMSSKIDAKMAQDILSARREIMLQKIADGKEKLIAAQKQLESQLRNARHLRILVPIQQKTRENIVIAAGRMAAQLKWGRVEIWRLKCLIDILSMDLEEEKFRESSSNRNSADETQYSDLAAPSL